MKNGYIRKIIDFSSIDGPGNRTVIFLQGCNFNCLSCHNPETIKIYNNLNSDNDEVKLMNVYDIVKRLDNNKSFIKGVTISGGECTLQFEFLLDLVINLKKNGYEVYLDTNGSLEIVKFQQILHYIDKIIFDLKVFDEKEHIKLTGASNRKVKRNIKIAGVNHKICEIRTVIIPKVIDNNKNVDKISKFICGIDKEIPYKLITYRQNGVRVKKLKTNSPSKKMMIELKEICKNNGLLNIIIN
ncbi:MAG: radical SAM protein [Bacillota bacterium]|nr:radical SAM protein [Bacillota bacterium]